MTWRTHMAVGANAIWIAGFFGRFDQGLLVYFPVALLASLLPDIDATSAKIHYLGGGVLGNFLGGFRGKYFHHRGLMHSLFVTVLLAVILGLLFGKSYPLLPYIFAASYISHPLIDGFNTSVGYLYPFVRKRFAFVPRSLQAKVGGQFDTLLMFLGIFGLFLFFALALPRLIPSSPTPAQW